MTWVRGRELLQGRHNTLSLIDVRRLEIDMRSIQYTAIHVLDILWH